MNATKPSVEQTNKSVIKRLFVMNRHQPSTAFIYPSQFICTLIYTREGCIILCVAMGTIVILSTTFAGEIMSNKYDQLPSRL